MRDILAVDPSPLVALSVFARQDTPASTRAAIHARIMSEEPSANWLTDLHADLDDNALEQQLMGELARRKLRTLRLPWITADPLPYVDSPYVCFRASAAQSDDLPARVVARLLEDEESSVRTTMALHAGSRIDAATAERIERSYSPVRKARWRPADSLPSRRASFGVWPPIPTRGCGSSPRATPTCLSNLSVDLPPIPKKACAARS